MDSNAYAFRTNWTFDAKIGEVAAILDDIDYLAEWWPSVYLEVRTLESGSETGIGKRVTLLTKGWLPYLLRWTFTVLESNSPFGYRISAEGDFVGEGVWTLLEKEGKVHVQFDWNIVANKPMLKKLSFLLKPIFSANHHWAMEQGRVSMDLEIRRRRGEKNVPAAPGPTFRAPNPRRTRQRI